MTGEETAGSRWFWWIMGIIATVVAAAIITALHLNGAQPDPGGGAKTQGQGLTTTPRAHSTTADYSGTYNGQALNGGVVGNIQLQVNEPDPSSGATTAHVTWSGALNGSGPLRGTFNANNADFEGEIASLEGPWDMNASCTFSNSDNVTCNYQLQPVAPNNYAPQQGSLSATKS